MRRVTKRRIPEHMLTRSLPGIPDVRRINCASLVGSVTEFCREQLRGAADVCGPPDVMHGAIGISPTQLGHALRVTIDELSPGGRVLLRFVEWEDEMIVYIEGAGIESQQTAARIAEAWMSAGFTVKSFGFYLALSIPFCDALNLVLRSIPKIFFKRFLENGYFRY